MRMKNISRAAISMFCFCLIFTNAADKKEDVKIEVLVPGSDCSRVSDAGSLLRVHYIGKLTTGKVFENSYENGKPVLFILGMGQTLKGWERGLTNMCKGEKRRLTIPPHLAYGSREVENIPPGSTLIYDIELLTIRSQDDVNDAFPRLDVNKDGVLDMSEVKTVITDNEELKKHIPINLDESMKFYLVQTMFQMADKNRDGGLDENEFKSLTSMGKKLLKKKTEL